MSRSSIPFATTLSSACFAWDSAIRSISVVAGSDPRRIAICAMFFFSYDGLGTYSPITRSSGEATSLRMKSVSDRSEKLRLGYSTVSDDCHIVYG